MRLLLVICFVLALEIVHASHQINDLIDRNYLNDARRRLKSLSLKVENEDTKEEDNRKPRNRKTKMQISIKNNQHSGKNKDISDEVENKSSEQSNFEGNRDKKKRQYINIKVKESGKRNSIEDSTEHSSKSKKKNKELNYESDNSERLLRIRDYVFRANRAMEEDANRGETSRGETSRGETSRGETSADVDNRGETSADVDARIDSAEARIDDITRYNRGETSADVDARIDSAEARIDDITRFRDDYPPHSLRSSGNASESKNNTIEDLAGLLNLQKSSKSIARSSDWASAVFENADDPSSFNILQEKINNHKAHDASVAVVDILPKDENMSNTKIKYHLLNRISAGVRRRIKDSIKARVENSLGPIIIFIIKSDKKRTPTHSKVVHHSMDSKSDHSTSSESMEYATPPRHNVPPRYKAPPRQYAPPGYNDFYLRNKRQKRGVIVHVPKQAVHKDGPLRSEQHKNRQKRGVIVHVPKQAVHKDALRTEQKTNRQE